MGDEEEQHVEQPAPVQAPVIQMAQSVAIQPMPVFHPEAEVGASLATRWKNWIADFDMFIIASGITDPKRKEHYFFIKQGPGSGKSSNNSQIQVMTTIMKRQRTN